MSEELIKKFREWLPFMSYEFVRREPSGKKIAVPTHRAVDAGFRKILEIIEELKHSSEQKRPEN